MAELIIMCQPQHLFSLEREAQDLLQGRIGEAWMGRSCKRNQGRIVLPYTGCIPASFLRWLKADKRIDDYFCCEMESAHAHRLQAKNSVLKYERERRGWSQAELAKKVGVDPMTVSRWERGASLPYPCYQEQLCALFGMSTVELGLLEEWAG